MASTERVESMEQKNNHNLRLYLVLVAVVMAGSIALGALRYWEGLRIQAEDEQWRTSQSSQGAAFAEISRVSDDGPEAFFKNEIQYQGKTYRKNTYIKAILGLGIDRNGSMEGTVTPGSAGQSDTVALIAHDTVHDTLKLLMIPRDTMTEIIVTDLSGDELAWDQNHLNLAFAYGDGQERSISYARRAVSRMLGGLPVDGCIAYGADALAVANDAVGGVTVQIDDPELAQKDPQLKLGETVRLSGEQAEIFLRYRNIDRPLTALERQERQKKYMEHFSQAVSDCTRKESGFAARLLDTMTPYLVTDMTKGDQLDLLLALIQNGTALDDADILTLPGEGVEGVNFDEYYMDQEAAYEMILNLFYRVE